ncbi:MAG: HAD-IA family hydrolase [Candidatus Pacebacteria bacterium]|nr:HAD-IA family hydrolase [Candidatus Paceibacterota bacterium]
MSNRIKFIYFDLGGVLFRFRGGLERLAKENSRQYEDFEKVFRMYDDKVCRGEMMPQDLWLKYKDELGLETKIDDFAEYWTDNFYPIVESHSLVNQLTRGYQIGLLTNIYSGVFSKIIHKGHIPNIDYSAVIQSCNVGYVKPEKEIYQLAQDKSEVLPNEILFVDDKQNFLSMADEMGWATILFDENNPKESVKQINSILN